MRDWSKVVLLVGGIYRKFSTVYLLVYHPLIIVRQMPYRGKSLEDEKIANSEQA